MVGMRKCVGLLAMALVPWNGIVAQRSGGSALVLQVNPEARVTPSSMALSLTASDQGSTSQSAMVSAWVRALPGTRIHLRASLTNLSGPDGSADPSMVVWTGAATQATGGGTAATCSNGRFAPASPQDLAQGWVRPGTLTCALTFRLATGAAPGVYTGTVAFSTLAN